MSGDIRWQTVDRSDWLLAAANAWEQDCDPSTMSSQFLFLLLSTMSTQFLFLLLSTMSTQFLFLLPLSTILPPCLLTTSTCPCVCVCVCRWNGHRNDSAQDPLSQSLPERSSRCSEPSLGELRVSVSISFYCVGTDTGWSRPNHVLHGEH